METVNIVTYQVTEEAAASNTKAVEAICEELAATSASGTQFAVLVGDDGVTFTHIVKFATEQDSAAFDELTSFKALQADLPNRIASPPDLRVNTIVGDLGLFAV